jgi:hypothetical protein
MSEYGELWARAADIRYQLQELLGDKLTGNYTPADARRLARESGLPRLIGTVDLLATQWEALEERMKQAED